MKDDMPSSSPSLVSVSVSLFPTSLKFEHVLSQSFTLFIPRHTPLTTLVLHLAAQSVSSVCRDSLCLCPQSQMLLQLCL